MAEANDVRGPLHDHPKVGEIEQAFRIAQDSNDHIASRFGVGSQDGVPPSEVVRRHRSHFQSVNAPEVPLDEQMAQQDNPAVVVFPDNALAENAEWVYVSAIIGKIGPQSRWVGLGDLITAEEAGNGVSHGTAYKLPARRGVIGLLRATFERIHALEALVLSQDSELLASERERMIKTRGLTADAQLVAEAERRGYEVGKA